MSEDIHVEIDDCLLMIEDLLKSMQKMQQELQGFENSISRKCESCGSCITASEDCDRK